MMYEPTELVQTLEYVLQGYVRKLGLCLLDISSDNGSPSSLDQLQRCSLEMTGLFVCYWCCNPQHVAILHSTNMQNGLPYEEAPPELRPEDLLVGNACTLKSQSNVCKASFHSVKEIDKSLSDCQSVSVCVMLCLSLSALQ